MDVDSEELLKKIQLARQAGVPEDQINARIKAQYGLDISQVKMPELRRSEKNWLYGPLVKFGGTTLEAGRKLINLTNPEYRQATFGDAGALSPEAQARVAKLDQPVFMSKHQQELTREKPLETGLKNWAGAAAYTIPAGKTLKGALALGGAMGGLRAVSEEKATPGSVVGGVAGGVIAGGLFYGAGKVFQKGKELLQKGGDKVGKKAAEDLLKATPTAYKNAAEAGYDLRSLVKKYGVVGNLDDMVGPIETPNSGWFQQALSETEKGLQGNLKTIGKQKVDLTPVLNQLEFKRGQLLKSAVPDEEAISALDDFIAKFTQSFKGRDLAGKFIEGNNVSGERALEMVRFANQEFGKAIIQTTKGTVNDQGNKVVAQTLRHTLKNQFPELGEALTREHELIILRDVLQDAQYKGLTGLGLGKFDLTRPLTAVEPLTKTPAVSSRLAQMQTAGEGAVPPTPAGMKPGSINWGADLTGTVNPVDDLVAQKANLVSQFKSLQSDFLNTGGKTTPAANKMYQSKLADLTKKIADLGEVINFTPSAPSAAGVVEGAGRPAHQALIEKALNTGDIKGAQAVVDAIPVGDPWKASMQNVINAVTGKVPATPAGLQPGSVDLGYISDFLKSGPKVTAPSLGEGIVRAGTYGAGLAGSAIMGGVPETPAGLSATQVKTEAKDIGQATDENTRAQRIANLMLKYPKYASQIKSAYETAIGGAAGGNVTKVSAQNYSNSLSGSASLTQVNNLIFKPDGSLDRATVASLKAPGTPSQRARQLKAQLYNVADSYLRLRTGAQANPDEIRRLANSLEPGLLDNAETVKTKLGIYDTVFRKYIELATGAGIQSEETVPTTPEGLYGNP